MTVLRKELLAREHVITSRLPPSNTSGAGAGTTSGRSERRNPHTATTFIILGVDPKPVNFCYCQQSHASIQRLQGGHPEIARSGCVSSHAVWFVLFI